MGFELPNGKTARNLQEQVKFLSEKLKDLYAAVNEIGIRVLVVSELPEEGEPLTIYFVPSEDASQENIYNEYMWIEDEWELIGSTAIDLSGYAELSGNNDFTGTNTFKSLSTVSPDGTQDVHFVIADNGNIDLKHNTDNILSFNSANYVVYNHLRPRRETYNLGNPDYKWNNLYLSGNVYLSGAASSQIQFGNSGTYIKTNSDNDLLINSSGGSIWAERSIKPASASLDLGYSSSQWQNLYLSGTAYIPTIADASSISFKINGIERFKLNGADAITGRLYPSINNTFNIGTNSFKYKDLYLSGNLSDGTNTVSIADLAALISYAKAQGWIS